LGRWWPWLHAISEPNIFPVVPASSPEALSAAFAAAINSGDVGAALDLWTEDAAIVRPDGQTVRGRDAIEGTLQALVDNDVTLEIVVANVVAAGGTAAAVGTLKITGTDGKGARFEQRSQSVVIYAKGPDGWRLVIDAPWGLPPGQ
jgi:uncharacterized protein (TIGR02246 family)